MATYETIKTVSASGITSVDGVPADVNDTSARLSARFQRSDIPRLLLSKTITANDGYYYAVTPKLKITSEHPEKYSIKQTNKNIDEKGRLLEITLEVYFIFKGTDIKESDGDRIETISSPVLIPIPTTKYINMATITGEPITTAGGVRTLKIMGDPGSTSLLTLKDSEGLYYHWDYEVFTSTASFKRITIPSISDFPWALPSDIRPGVYLEDVHFPKTAGYPNITYTTIVTPESDLDTLGEGDSVKDFSLVAPDVRLTFKALAMTGLTFTYSMTPLIVGPFQAGKPVSTHDGIIEGPGRRAFEIIGSTSGTLSGFSSQVIAIGSWVDGGTHGGEEGVFSNGWELDLNTVITKATSNAISISISGFITTAGTTDLTVYLDFDTFLDYAA